MNPLKTTLAATAAVVFAMLSVNTSATAGPAGLTAPGTMLLDSAETSLVQEVAKWDRKRHGDRKRSRGGKYRHYHGGYWYATPWWMIPAIGIGIGIGAARCDSVHRDCRRRYGGGSDYRRCMRRNDCRV